MSRTKVCGQALSRIFMTRKNAFLDQVKKGESSWWRYLLGLEMVSTVSVLLPLVILLLFNITSTSFSDAELNNCENREISDGHFTSNCVVTVDVLSYFSSPVSQLILFFSMFPLTILLLWLVLRLIHQRTLSTIISWNGTFRWKRFLIGMGTMFLLMSLFLALSYFIFPNNFELVWEGKWLFYLIPVIVILTIQVTAEELFFRGYVTQTVGYFTRNNIFILVVPSLLFASIHGFNPEYQSWGWIAILTYFIIGVFLSIITLLDQGIEIAIGFHLANNLFSGLVLTYPNSAIDFLPAIVRQKEVFIVYESLTFIVLLILFLIIVYRQRR